MKPLNYHIIFLFIFILTLSGCIAELGLLEEGAIAEEAILTEEASLAARGIATAEEAGALRTAFRGAGIEASAGRLVVADETALLNQWRRLRLVSEPNFKYPRIATISPNGRVQTLAELVGRKIRLPDYYNREISLNHEIYVVRNKVVNVRSSYSNNGRVIDRIYKEDLVIKLYERNGWYKVMIEKNKVGWIKASPGVLSIASINSSLKSYSQICDSCGGAKVTYKGLRCQYCNGDGYQRCSYCSGVGIIACYMCQGNGNILCYYCAGNKYVDCSACVGTGRFVINGIPTMCSSCQGYGRFVCNNCQGNGYTICSFCRGQKSSLCLQCNGKKGIGCTNCKGYGFIPEKINCPNCQGFGKVLVLYNKNMSNEIESHLKPINIISGEYKSYNNPFTLYAIITTKENQLSLIGMDYSGSKDIRLEESFVNSNTTPNKYISIRDSEHFILVQSKKQFLLVYPGNPCQFLKTN